MLNDSQMDETIAYKIYLVHQTPFHTEAVSKEDKEKWEPLLNITPGIVEVHQSVTKKSDESGMVQMKFF